MDSLEPVVGQQEFSLRRLLAFAWRVVRQHCWALFIPSLCASLLFAALITLLDVPSHYFGLAQFAWSMTIDATITIGTYRSMLAWSLGGDRPAIGGVFYHGLRRYWDGIRVYAVLFLYLVLPCLVLSPIFDYLGAALNSWVYGVLATALFIWVISRFCLSLICMADEGQGAFDAVHRSLSLTEGKFLGIAAAIISLMLVFVACVFALSYGFYRLGMPFPAKAVSLALVTLSQPFIFAFVFTCYLELKNHQKPAWAPRSAPAPGSALSDIPKDGL